MDKQFKPACMICGREIVRYEGAVHLCHGCGLMGTFAMSVKHEERLPAAERAITAASRLDAYEKLFGPGNRQCVNSWMKPRRK